MTSATLQIFTQSMKRAYALLSSPLWIFDIERQCIVWANQAAVNLWQADSVEDLIERDFASGMSEATHTRLLSYLEHLNSGGETTESWTFYPGGKAMTMRCHFTGVLLEEGERLVTLVQTDTVDEQNLSEVRGVEALRHTNLMITLSTPGGDVLTENPAAVRAYSFTAQEKAEYHAILDRFADKKVAQEAMDTLQRDTRFSGEVRMRTQIGERWHSIDAFCTTDPATGDPAVLINESDITRMMLAEQKVRAARDELEETVARRTAQLEEAHVAVAEEKTFVSAVLDAVGSLVIVTTPTGEIVRVNRAVCALSGLSSKQLQGRTCRDMLAVERPDDSSDWSLGFCVAADGTIPSASEGYMRSMSGDERFIAWSHAVLHKADGSPEHLIAAGLDISERRELQGQLQLADRMASIGTLASGVAHEVNNPLTYVMTNLEMLRDSLDTRSQAGYCLSAKEMAECSTDALAGAERISRIVHDLSVFTRASNTRVEPIDLHKVIDFSINLADHQWRPRARLVRSSDSIPMVLGNEARLGQVILNLLVNAAQAIPEGDALENVISIRTFTDTRGFCVTEIEDTGSGIASENLVRIFDPFFTTKTGTNGTGLGLSICHRIVAEMGGELTAENCVGAGAKFRLSLPAAAGIVSTISKSKPRAKLHGNRKILVVDDEEGILRAFQRILHSHEVVVCQSGRAVPEIVQSQGPFDLIFCDLAMPDGTGADVYKELTRVSPEHIKRLVFMTGGVSTAEMREFLEEVPNECLEKPIGSDGIRAVVAKHFIAKDE